jgi:hypothetical protein
MVTNEFVQYKVKKETVRETLQVRKTKQRTGTTKVVLGHLHT